MNLRLGYRGRKLATVIAVVSLVLNGCAELKPGGERPCAHRVPPPRPTVGEQSDSLPDLVFARSVLYRGTQSTDDAGRPAVQSLGLDLDETCTGEGQGPSCQEPVWVPQDHYDDGIDGIDNAAGRSSYRYFPGLSDMLPAMGTETGPDEEELFRLRGYSGLANDEHVEVDLYAALGLDPRDDGTTVPQWDGNDHWRILQDYLRPPSLDVDDPQFVDPDAYVANDILVAHFTNVPLPTFLQLAPDSLYQVAQLVLMGRLTNDGSQWALEDLVEATRAKVSDVLSFAARFPVIEDPSHPLCEFPSLYKGLEQNVCSYEDISSSPNSGPSACDALSGATLLQAKQAQLGSVRPSAGPLPMCDPSVQPDKDMCQSLAGP